LPLIACFTPKEDHGGVNQRLLEYQNLKCSKHNNKVKYFCPVPDCFEKNNSLLCVICFDEHFNEHKPISSAEIFSTALLDDITTSIEDAKQLIPDNSAKNSSIFDYIDVIYGQVETTLITMLKSSKEAVKHAIKGNYSNELMKLKEDLEKLINSCFNDHSNDLNNYLKTYPKIYEDYKKCSREKFSS